MGAAAGDRGVGPARPRVSEVAIPIADYAHFVELLSRVGCHVYSGEIAPDGTYFEAYTGPGVERFLGEAPPAGTDPAVVWNNAVHPDDAEQYRAAGLDPTQRSATAEYRLVTADGTVRWVLDQMWVRGTAPNGNRRVDGVVTDITARKTAELELLRLAQHDSLTKLANRRQFDDQLDRELAALPEAEGDNAGLALLLLDLDRFKDVNDSLGHIAGDELLLAAARRISSCLRSVDLAARFGGDEFVVILTGVDLAGATLVADRIRDAIAAPFSIGGEAVVSTASIGLAHVARPVPRHKLLSAADAAMYDAKATGRNRVVVASDPAASRTGWPATRR